MGRTYGIQVDNLQATGESATSRSSYKVEYGVYRWRWFMLAVLWLINVSNGMMWLTYAPIPDLTALYYQVPESSVNLFSIVYFIVSLVIGLVAIIVIEYCGLKVAIYLGASCNFIGALIRWLSTAHPVICSAVFPQAGFTVALIGQILTAVAQPFLLYSPTTLAGTWFGPKERAVCTSIASVANPIGLAIAQVSAPYIVSSSDQLPTLLWSFSIPAGLSFVLALVAFWWKEPAIAPAPRLNDSNTPSFIKGLWMTVKNFSFWVLLLVWGTGAGMFNALLTLLPQVLCPYGYSDRQSGLWGSLMIFLGLVGATLAGVIIDYTKKYKDVAVTSFSIALLCTVWFYEVSTLEGQAVNIAFSLSCFGFFALALLPACMELGVEVTYPVAEAISTGLLWSASQVIGIILVFLSQVLSVEISFDQHPNHKCLNTKANASHSTLSCFQSNVTDPIPLAGSSKLYDPSHTILLCLVLTITAFITFVFAFHPKYRRSASEREAAFEKSVYVGAKM